ncbi:MAG: CsbD family protein [Phycisphaerales bacterium]|nr:CsbD family protein [Phycisphaerales bacterium]
MNKDTTQGNWKQMRGKVKEKWGKLTDDDLDVIDGKRDQLVGKIQERYGQERDAVKKEVDRFYDESAQRE